MLSEVIDIFPSKYIHIGGDETPRDRWKECLKCQARIKTERLKKDQRFTAEDRLQSYCMARIERFLNKKGRCIIGWDEILDGDIAPNATVMSWRGSEGGIKAAKTSVRWLLLLLNIFAILLARVQIAPSILQGLVAALTADAITLSISRCQN